MAIVKGPHGNGVGVKDVTAAAFIDAYAAFLKRGGKVDVPMWSDIVKTGVHKEHGPYNPDWFYVRVAAVARHVYVRGTCGVGGLKKAYGSSYRRGTMPSHHQDGSGSIARKVLQTLETLKIVEKAPNGGRRITREGQRDLDRIAVHVKNAAAEDEDDDEDDDEDEDDDDDDDDDEESSDEDSD